MMPDVSPGVTPDLMPAVDREALRRLLWRCPGCDGEGTPSADGDGWLVIRCFGCGRRSSTAVPLRCGVAEDTAPVRLRLCLALAAWNRRQVGLDAINTGCA